MRQPHKEVKACGCSIYAATNLLAVQCEMHYKEEMSVEKVVEMLLSVNREVSALKEEEQMGSNRVAYRIVNEEEASSNPFRVTKVEGDSEGREDLGRHSSETVGDLLEKRIVKELDAEALKMSIQISWERKEKRGVAG